MDKTIINSLHAPEPIGPYSQAVLIDRTLYVSGQIAIARATGNMVNETIESETAQVMQNLRYILEEAGLTFSNVIKCSIFIRNMDDFSKINGEYGKCFLTDPPARETVEVSRLPKDVNVEISCVAVK